MSTSSVFTQKHYEHLMREIRSDTASDEAKQRAAEILCRVFKRDNPKFKPDVFVGGVFRRGEQQ